MIMELRVQQRERNYSRNDWLPTFDKQSRKMMYTSGCTCILTCQICSLLCEFKHQKQPTQCGMLMLM
jgi:hypothetical protein